MIGVIERGALMAKGKRRNKAVKAKAGKMGQAIPQGDIGPDTPAQRAGATIVNVREDSGAEFRRKRRSHALEAMHAQGKISARQCAAGLELHRLYCMTELSPASAFTRVYVDSSARPDETTLRQAERVTRFVALSRHVPRDCEKPVWHVAIRSRMLRDGFSRNGYFAAMHTAQLQVALDILANELGL